MTRVRCADQDREKIRQAAVADYCTRFIALKDIIMHILGAAIWYGVGGYQLNLNFNNTQSA